MPKRLALPLIAAACLLAGVAALSLSGEARDASANQGDGGFVDHPSIVPAEPDFGYPILLDTPNNGNLPRQTHALDLIGDYIVNGGDFINVELQDGTVATQERLAIFDTTNKELVCPQFAADKDVLAIARGHEPHTAIIAGKFNNLTGANGTFTRGKIGKINMETCEVMPWRITGINNKVTELALSGERLFIGGDFTSIDGQSIEKLAEVSHREGILNPAMSFTFELGWVTGRTIVGLEAKSDGTRLAAIHRAIGIDGNDMRATAVFDISDPANPILTPHRAKVGSIPHTYYHRIQDGAVSPDFSYMAIGQFATVSDYVTRISTTEAAEQLDWEHYMRDSTFSVAISNNAIYVGGHFCRIDAGPGSVEMTPNVIDQCTGVGMGDNCARCNGLGGAWRSQIAALNPADGSPLEWNPGIQAYNGARALTVVNRGLLVGQDSTKVHSPGIYTTVGTSMFFDFGATPDAREVQTCTATVDATGSLVDISWDPVTGVSNWEVIRNDATISTETALTTTDTPGFGTWSYEIRSLLDGRVWDTPCNPTVTISPSCSATLAADNTITIDWVAANGVDDYQVRRNAGWLATVNNVTTYTDDPGVGTWTYEIRYWDGGVATDVVCNPPITIDAAAVTCTATGAGDVVTLEWDAVPGATTYVVRRNGGWLATPENTLTYSDTAGPGTWDYVIRAFNNGTFIDVTCNPTITIDPPAPATCTATVVGNVVTLNWDAVPGTSTYVVRRNNAWLATPPGTPLTYSDTASAGTWSYVIRAFNNGVATDITCNPTITI